MVTDKKKNGVYYTPTILTDFLIQHIFSNYLKKTKKISILEPSAGDGKFMDSLLKKNVLADKEATIELLDIDQEELLKAVNIFKTGTLPIGSKVRYNNIDYLKHKSKKYDLVIGNPPYINKKYLSKEQIEECKTIILDEISDYGEVKNIWPAFLFKAAKSLKEKGVMCFVLPAEILQVKYTAPIREYILKIFSKVEVFAFNELIFPFIEQDVVVLIGEKNKKRKESEISFYQVEKLKDLKIPDYTKKNSNIHRKKLNKWTNYILSDEELSFIDDMCLKHEFTPIDDYCDTIGVGIVTAANSYFIINQKEVRAKGLEHYAKKMIGKSSMLNNCIYFSEEDFDLLQERNKAVNFIQFPEVGLDKLSKKAKEYIQEGAKKELDKRYKMKLREHWYHVPSVWKSDAFFTKRSHLYPRIMENKAEAYITDSLYRINTNTDTDTSKFIFSFYNILTFILAELGGRFYGGGVLELTPSEFKELPIPYNSSLRKNQLSKLDRLFRENKSINEILEYTNPRLLKGISKEEIDSLSKIWLKLLSRRLKKPIAEVF